MVLFSTVLMLLQMYSSIEVDASKAAKVDVTVYYSSLCWYSKRFIADQLLPTYNEMSDIMKVTLIPYGKAKFTENENGTISFDCRFGPKECKAMFMQSCALNIYPNMSEVLPFIACMEKSNTPETEGERCAVEANLNISQLNHCSNGKQAQKYLKENGRKTLSLKPKLDYVPWILFNGIYSRPMQLEAREDLKFLICKLYNEMNGPKTNVAGCTTTYEIFN